MPAGLMPAGLMPAGQIPADRILADRIPAGRAGWTYGARDGRPSVWSPGRSDAAVRQTANPPTRPSPSCS